MLLEDMTTKIEGIIKCVSHLDDFVNNRLYNSSIDQKYGTINHKRQKLMREQYYIDILVKILEDAMPRHDLELWMRRH